MNLLAIILGTFFSEDLTCIHVGLLIQAGKLDVFTGLLGCYIGILAGDFGLWFLGRTGRHFAGRWSWLARRMPHDWADRPRALFEGYDWATVFAARFFPGARMPVYLAAGALGRKAHRFLLVAAAAALIWTPLLVGGVALVGERLVAPLERFFKVGWVAVVVAALMLFLGVRLLTLLATESGRLRLWVRISRIYRWEFWPTWLFYIPLLPWLAWLAIRHRGLTVFTSANPAMPHGGIVGESKWDILRRLPPEWIVPTALITTGPPGERAAEVAGEMEKHGWTFPMILKPDVGERGAGLKQLHSLAEAEAYFAKVEGPVLLQCYHPGPFEAGIFYYRMPGNARGRIFSITDKVFPQLTGNGHSTARDLIWHDSRLRMQARTFLARLDGQADRVLADGEQLTLAVSGNHCQGTLFRDGSHLITPELEDAIDGIARQVEGFYIGRFDVRYGNVKALRAGQGFQIVELNGASSESTNVYDPSWPIHRAYGVLARQWALLYAIGARNRDQGHAPTPARKLWSEVRRYYRHRHVPTLAD
ncbi:MAG: VTT domain-containing protein [Phycisphaerae bacterium]|nr:VTT domain-containing protein [Phycisphaerae bacterium]